MDRLRKASLAVYAVNVFLGILIGAVYLSRSEFLPYHAEAVGMDWAHIPDRMRLLLLALIHVAGGLAVAGCAAVGTILFCAFRRGDPWADWAVPVLLLLMQIPTLIVPLEVSLRTGAATPWPASVGGIGITLIGMLLTVLAHRRKPDP
jgi:hypothetical protein